MLLIEFLHRNALLDLIPRIHFTKSALLASSFWHEMKTNYWPFQQTIGKAQKSPDIICAGNYQSNHIMNKCSVVIVLNSSNVIRIFRYDLLYTYLWGRSISTDDVNYSICNNLNINFVIWWVYYQGFVCKCISYSSDIIFSDLYLVK